MHIDEAVLEARFKELQRAVHPDRYMSRGSDMLAMAEQQSSALNSAMAIMRNPLKRASYLVCFPCSLIYRLLIMGSGMGPGSSKLACQKDQPRAGLCKNW